MSIKKLLSLISEHSSRKQLYDFNMFYVDISVRVSELINDFDEFYKMLSQADFDENNCAETVFKDHFICIAAKAIDQENQIEDLVIFHVALIEEEAEKLRQLSNLCNFFESGVVEIE